MTDDERAEYDEFLHANQRLTTALSLIRRRMSDLMPMTLDGAPYRVALRPDDRHANPLSISTLLDDIVVNGVPCFRAEQMDERSWWVACYLDDVERICWSVRAKGKPLRLEWVTTEFPDSVVYEHQAKAS